MLSLDRNKMIHWSPNTFLSPNTAAPFAQLRGCECENPGLGSYGTRNVEGNAAPPISGMGYITRLNEGMTAPPISGMGYLGQDAAGQDLIDMAAQFDPEPISRAALTIVASVENFFSIGAGRREADEIVPYQNEIANQVLAPIAAAVNAPYKNQLSGSQLNTMLTALLRTKDSWLSFLHNTNWSDGRAAVQAENTLAFLFSDQERKIRELLVNAPLFGTAQAPNVQPVYIPGSNVPMYPPTYNTGYGSFSSIGSTLTQYAPYILLGIALFALPKIGKYQH